MIGRASRFPALAGVRLRARSGRRTRAVAVLGALAVLGLPAVVASPAAQADVAGPAVTEVIVTIDPAVTSLAAVNRAHRTTLVAPSSGLADTYLLRLPAGADAELAADAIEASPGVLDAAPNSTLTPPEIDQDRVYAWRVYAWSDGTPVPAVSAYALDALDLTEAHKLSIGAGVVVAVLDTGVQLDHPALKASLVAGRDVVGADATPADTGNGRDDDGDGEVDEGAGHGTHVAGIVHQVAPGARIMPVRVLDDEGSGTMWQAAEGMLWAAGHGARVINASFGAHGSAGVLKSAVEQLTAQGVLVVGAAGNDGKDRTMYPAAADGALAVGSVGPGDVASSFTNHGRWIDVVAPGEAIHSTFAVPAGTWAANSGTSMATPFVSGEAALVLARRPSSTPAQVTDVITSSAVPVDAVNRRLAGELGSGRIDARAAVVSA